MSDNTPTRPHDDRAVDHNTAVVLAILAANGWTPVQR